MQSKIEWLDEQGWKSIRKSPRKPRCFRVVTGGQARDCRSAQATGDELMSLLNRIGWEDYLLDCTLRKQIKEMLYGFSDDEFIAFCKYYEKLLLNKTNLKLHQYYA